MGSATFTALTWRSWVYGFVPTRDPPIMSTVSTLLSVEPVAGPCPRAQRLHTTNTHLVSHFEIAHRAVGVHHAAARSGKLEVSTQPAISMLYASVHAIGLQSRDTEHFTLLQQACPNVVSAAGPAPRSTKEQPGRASRFARVHARLHKAQPVQHVVGSGGSASRVWGGAAPADRVPADPHPGARLWWGPNT